MSAELFSDEWAAAWAAEINASDSYRVKASKWEGALALVIQPDPTLGVPERRAVLVDLSRGECRSARAATDDDLAEAPYVLTGSAAVWDQVLYGQLEPAAAVMMALLSLERGSLRDLVPFIPAANQLLLAATRVDTLLPEGWERPEDGR